MGNMADSSNTTATTASAASDTGRKTTSSAGALAPSKAKTPAKLTSDQQKQLQTALNNDGCSVGTPDGVMGAKTTKAVACSMTKHNIQNNDYSALYQALNLSF
jgi:peptidoglycan hydrolase-like protein with peptidoglycan-binding domain